MISWLHWYYVLISYVNQVNWAIRAATRAAFFHEMFSRLNIVKPVAL